VAEGIVLPEATAKQGSENTEKKALQATGGGEAAAEAFNLIMIKLWEKTQSAQQIFSK